MKLPIRSVEVQNEYGGGLVLQMELGKPLHGEHWMRIHLPDNLVPKLIEDLQICYAIGQSEEGQTYDGKSEGES